MSKEREREEKEKRMRNSGPPKAMAPPMTDSSLILGYLKLCSRGASAGREATNSGVQVYNTAVVLKYSCRTLQL
jgi:hypothetical protein